MRGNFSVGDQRLRAALIGARSLAFRLTGPSALGVSCGRLDMLAALVVVLRCAVRLAEATKSRAGVWNVVVLGDGRSPRQELEEVILGLNLVLDLVYALGDAEDAAGGDEGVNEDGESGDKQGRTVGP